MGCDYVDTLMVTVQMSCLVHVAVLWIETDLTSSWCMETWHLMGLSTTQYFEEIVFCVGFRSESCCVHVTLKYTTCYIKRADLDASLSEELGKGV